MDLNALSSRISAINNEVRKINNERQVNIGKRQTLQAQLDSQLAQYKEQYGVELTADTLQAEIDRVSSELSSHVEKMEGVLAQIRSGNYAQAELMLGISVINKVAPSEEVASSGESLELSDSGEAEESAEPIQQSEPVQSEASVEPEKSKMPPTFSKPVAAEEQPASEPVQPKLPPTFSKPSAEEEQSMPETKATGQIKRGSLSGAAKFTASAPEDEEDGEMPAPPPAPPKMSFSAILNGTAFDPSRR